MGLLQSAFQTLFAPWQAVDAIETGSAWLLWLCVAAILALMLGGSFDLGGPGLVAMTLFLWGTLLVAWFWSCAALSAIAQGLGGGGTQRTTMGVVAEAFWPLILLGPISVLAHSWPALHGILHALIFFWVLLLLVFGVHRVQGVSAGRAFCAILLTAAMLLAGLVAWIGVPLVAWAYFSA